jgi:uncharacterized YigZ family protein
MISAMDGYLVPAVRHRREQVVERSRFVATIDVAATPEAARAVVAEIGAEWRDATHHCFAFVCGPPGSEARIGLSDAGEPHGTAGRPMLDVLLGSGVGDVVAVVSRWFGGVKLGKGGLSRAYSSAVAYALEDAPLVLEVERIRIVLTFAYEQSRGVSAVLERFAALPVAESFAARIERTVAIPKARCGEFERALEDATRGRVDFRILGP